MHSNSNISGGHLLKKMIIISCMLKVQITVFLQKKKAFTL